MVAPHLLKLESTFTRMAACLICISVEVMAGYGWANPKLDLVELFIQHCLGHQSIAIIIF